MPDRDVAFCDCQNAMWQKAEWDNAIEIIAMQSATLAGQKPGGLYARLFTTGPVWANRSGKSRPGKKTGPEK